MESSSKLTETQIAIKTNETNTKNNFFKKLDVVAMKK